MLVSRFLALAIGYIIGLFQTGYFYGKSKNMDIREHGSGNSGTTNTLRVLGWKAGAITFIGDLFKAILSIVIVWFVFKDKYPEGVKLIELYAGFGAVLGHNFPFYLKFKGGKGIACTAGVVLAVCPYAAPICLILFIAIVAITRYVSLGSIVMVITFLTQAVIFNYLGICSPGKEFAIEYDILVALFATMAIWRHRANIVRLLNGTENKLGQKKE